MGQEDKRLAALRQIESDLPQSLRRYSDVLSSVHDAYRVSHNSFVDAVEYGSLARDLAVCTPLLELCLRSAGQGVQSEMYWRPSGDEVIRDLLYRKCSVHLVYFMAVNLLKGPPYPREHEHFLIARTAYQERFTEEIARNIEREKIKSESEDVRFLSEMTTTVCALNVLAKHWALAGCETELRRVLRLQRSRLYSAFIETLSSLALEKSADEPLFARFSAEYSRLARYSHYDLGTVNGVGMSTMYLLSLVHQRGDFVAALEHLFQD